jgi:hypothetical protein
MIILILISYLIKINFFIGDYYFGINFVMNELMVIVMDIFG